ncbi:OLC1v1030842C1 [Oldenlandia corymbosa var. corymbosa]|uniref:OLC1v1030842C1 n=1 Tax=Oldenlandia corymbosa var. corymbosa TaxID=529605 RepID=A0AAV1CJY1_OLDCO|nr:OLC1v1030842C1 [Oldenlandia corymbosa var. corymbosa]
MAKLLTVVLIVAAMVMPLVLAYESVPAKVVKTSKGKKYCTKGWECTTPSIYCCNLTISDYFQVDNFEQFFEKRNSPIAHAVGFWDYQSFIIASSLFQHKGFGTTGNKTMQMLELCAFLGHVGSGTTCGSLVSTGGPYAWGLCYNHEMSPSQSFCNDDFKLTYPCAPGADYFGRGAIPVYWNNNYGRIGEGINEDLLNHPEKLEQNATIAWIAAMHQWMTPAEKGLPSPHEVFIGDWKPTKNDTLENRLPGFGSTMNLLYGENVCNKGDDATMGRYINHFLYYADLLGVGREKAGPHEVLTCEQSKQFKPASGKASS